MKLPDTNWPCVWGLQRRKGHYLHLYLGQTSATGTRNTLPVGLHRILHCFRDCTAEETETTKSRLSFYLFLCSWLISSTSRGSHLEVLLWVLITINIMICLFSNVKSPKKPTECLIYCLCRAFPILCSRISVVSYSSWAGFFSYAYLTCFRLSKYLKMLKHCGLEIFLLLSFGWRGSTQICSW